MSWKDLEKMALDKKVWRCGCGPMPPWSYMVKKKTVTENGREDRQNIHDMH
jgi:hypothetical protein